MRVFLLLSCLLLIVGCGAQSQGFESASEMSGSNPLIPFGGSVGDNGFDLVQLLEECITWQELVDEGSEQQDLEGLAFEIDPEGVVPINAGDVPQDQGEFDLAEEGEFGEPRYHVVVDCVDFCDRLEETQLYTADEIVTAVNDFVPLDNNIADFDDLCAD